MSKPITSKWNFKVKIKKNSDWEKILKNKLIGTIIDRVTYSFIKKNPNYEYMEVRNLALVGMWNAIRKYDPKRGKFTNYAGHVCRAYIINGCDQIDYNDDNLSLPEIENCIYIENDLNSKIQLESIFSNLNKKERHILSTAFINYNYDSKEKGHIAKLLKVNRYKLKLKIDEILLKAKQYAE